MPKEQYYIDMMAKDWRETVNPKKIPILERRIALTVSCRDADDLPRVKNAGECLVDEHGNAVQIAHNGLKLQYGRYYGAWVNAIISELKGVHEPQQEKVFSKVLERMPKGAVMVEMGCYWGYYSLWFTKEVKKGRAFLIEPQSNQMKTAQANFKINGYEADFTVGYFGVYSDKKTEIQQRRLQAPLHRYTLAEYMEFKGLQKIDILHADIQGSEEILLTESEAELAARKVDYLFISTHGSTHPVCLGLLQRHGYRIIAEHPVDRAAGADGLIVAQNPELEPMEKIEVSQTLTEEGAAINRLVDGVESDDNDA